MRINVEALWSAIVWGVAVFGIIAAPGLVWLIWLETKEDS